MASQELEWKQRPESNAVCAWCESEEDSDTTLCRSADKFRVNFKILCSNCFGKFRHERRLHAAELENHDDEDQTFSVH